MSERFKVIVGGTIESLGVGTYMVSGTAIEVNGRPYVELTHGNIVRDEGYSPTRGEAQLVAAMEIEVLSRRLADQAERMRAAAGQEVAA